MHPFSVFAAREMSPTNIQPDGGGGGTELPQPICDLPTNLRREKAKMFGSLAII